MQSEVPGSLYQSQCEFSVEHRHLIELIEEVPIREAAKILRRSPPSIRSMLHRLGLGARQSREWFTVSLFAQSLHISRSEVQKWIDRGWLQCRTVQVQGVTRKIIDAEGFCLFVKNHGRAVIGNASATKAWFLFAMMCFRGHMRICYQCEAPMGGARSQHKLTRQPSLTEMNVTHATYKGDWSILMSQK